MGHEADRVFDHIAAGILRGDLPAGATLPAERVFAERLGVSRIIVRQAVHRLAELGLVEVSQGGATRVLDPEAATDVRLLPLFYRLAPESGPSAADVVEKQYLQGLSIVSVAERRASRESLRRLSRLVESFQHGEQKSAPVEECEELFWRGLVKAGGNRIFMMEVAFWYDTLEARPEVVQVTWLPRKTRLGFYSELVRRLVERDRAAAWYLEVVSPLLARSR